MIFLKTIIGWLIFMVVGSNLLGLVVRGLYQPNIKTDNENPVLNEIVYKHKRANIIVTIFFTALTICCFLALYYFWNIGVVISATMTMLSRLPDILTEIRTGVKTNRKNRLWKPINILAEIMNWSAIPVLWYSLYVQNNYTL